MIVRIILFVLLITSCVKTEVINELPTKPQKQQDTTIYIPPTDTGRVVIIFDPFVEDWDEKTNEL